MGEDERLARLLPAEALVADHTPRHAGHGRCGALPVAACAGAATGRDATASPSSATRTRTRFLGTAHVKAGELIPGRLLSPIEIQQILERN